MATKWYWTWHYYRMRTRDEVSEFAIELNKLCAIRWPGGSRTANAEIADWVTAETGRNIDRQFVWRIRKGRVMKVDGAVRDAICSFFGVSKDHFSSNPRTLGEEVQAAIEETGLQVAGLRADQLSSTGRAELATLLREVSRVLEAEKSVGQ